MPCLALSFDDHYIDDWHGAADILHAHGVRATFFAYGFPHVPYEAISKFYALLAMGHEIGFHSASHAHALDYIAKHGVAHYLQHEIIEGVAGQRMFGFTPKSFAYPCSARNEELDAAIGPLFTALRARANTFAEAMAWPATRPLILSRNCDLVRADGATLRIADDTVHELRLAARAGRSLALDAHGVTDKDDAGYHHITRRGLDYILWSARRLGFTFVTTSEFASLAQ